MFWGTVERIMKKNILMAAMTALLGTQAFASLTLLTDRSQIAATADLGIGQFGPVNTIVPSGSIGTTTGTDVFGVKIEGTSSMKRLDEGNGWFGFFNSGENLLWTTDGEVVKFTQAKSAQAVGMDVQRNYFGDKYTLHLAAYDGLGQLLGQVDSDVSAFSAGFIGARSSDNNILSYYLWVTSEATTPNNFAFDHVSIECCNPVPEPATMSALGLGALALLRRKRNS